jgi:hypothetical protein
VALKYHEVTCRWMAYDAQQDRVDGDRRDVPVETLASKETAGQPKEEIISETPRVRSRSFSAMTRLAEPWVDPPNPKYQTGASGQTSGQCTVANTVANAQSSAVSILQMPSTWIWRCVLRADTILVYAFRSMLMLDPKPDSYRARR